MIHLTPQLLSPRELIQNVFSPLVGTICSPQAEDICQKNHLSFVEMLQPFTKLSSDAYFRDTSGTVNSIKGIRINVCDIGWRPPQTILARKMLGDSVTTSQCDRTKYLRIDENTTIDIPVAEPWFEKWRETFLSVQFPADHEFTRHFLSCFIVLSSADPNPLDSAHQLTKKVQMMQNVTPPKLPKWFCGDILNCYVMLHDGGTGDITKAQQAFESLKLAFGDNRCFLLQINSFEGQNPNSMDNSDPWAKYLKRQPKTDGQLDQESAPRTPQDGGYGGGGGGGVTSMPLVVQSSTIINQLDTSIVGGLPMGATVVGATGTIITTGNEEVVDHPLSPVAEYANEAIHSNFSTSCDSLTSQVVNVNVWANESSTVGSDIDAPHGQWLTPSDIDNLKHFIQDFTIRSLIPHVEKLVGILSDAVANKKGVSRSLLSATKRWFVTNKPGVNTMQNAVVYTNDSIELQTRKLGDLYFMFGNYNLAFQAYHQAKRDFNADSAWQYYAGALEMAALAAFMSNTSNRKTYDYMEESIVTYLNICKLPQFATRATILSLECLRSAKLYGEAAKQLIRMTSEDSDLRSALLLEQASYCFLTSQPPLYRKYAFHIVLSGHRYSKAGQRKHAFRCYKQAYQVFEQRGWSLAEDHIQYTIGKQAVTLKKMDEASAALAHLLRPSSLQSQSQQAAFLREYIATQKTLLNQSGNEDLLLDISLPKIVHNLTRVLVTSHPPVTRPNLVAATNVEINTNLENEWKWTKLEEIVVQIASEKPIMIFKPLRSLFTVEMPTRENPLSIHGEPIEISFVLENTIKPSITFEDINLLWTFTKDNGETFSNGFLFKNAISTDEQSRIYDIVASTYVKCLQLNEHERKNLIIKLTPKFTGQLKIDGVVGRISATNEPASLWGKIDFESIAIKGDMQSSQMDKPQEYDRKLQITILPPAPSLQVSFSTMPHEVLAGEIIPIQIHLTNAAGIDAIHNVYAASEYPRLILGDLNNNHELPLSVLRDFKDLTNEALSRDKEARKQHVFPVLKSTSAGAALAANETKCVTIWFQAPYKKGPTDIRILIYYTLPDNYPKIKYRLIRHSWHLNVNESLSCGANCNITNFATNELGINMDVKNLNQVHHPLMTEIFISDIIMYCSKYKINQQPNRLIYLQSPGQKRICEQNAGLRSTESFSFRFSLNESPSPSPSAAPLVQTNGTTFIESRLSKLNIKYNPTVAKQIPSVQQLGSFLMKHETKLIGTLGQPCNNEEFHRIISTADPHMTMAIQWMAIVNDNSSAQRHAHGQHFIQLRHLYETVYCPPSEKMQQTTFIRQEEMYGIYEFQCKIQSQQQQQQQYLNEVDDWEPTTMSIAHRCFLEVDDRIQQLADDEEIKITLVQ